MVEASILPVIRARLAGVLRRPVEEYWPFRVDGDTVGWLDPARAGVIAGFTDVFNVRAKEIVFASPLASAAARTAALAEVTRGLAAAGHLTPWRNELYAVGRDFRVAPHFLIERAAARFFGVRTYAAHVNGLVAARPPLESSDTSPADAKPTAFIANAGREDGGAMWIARRSASKAIDPGMLDNLVGGGIAADMSVAATIAKEAWEEAGIPEPLARQATARGALQICRAQPDGLHRETIFVHDLWLSHEFKPENHDGEVASYRLIPLARTANLIANVDGADVVTADASLVILDCLMRLGMVAADAPDYLALDVLGHPATPFPVFTNA